MRRLGRRSRAVGLLRRDGQVAWMVSGFSWERFGRLTDAAMDCDVRAFVSFRLGSVLSGQVLVEGEGGGVRFFGFARVGQRTIGEQGFAGTFEEKSLFVTEKLVD